MGGPDACETARVPQAELQDAQYSALRMLATLAANASAVMDGVFQYCEMASSIAPVSAGGDNISCAGTCLLLSTSHFISFWAQTSSEPPSRSRRTGMEPFFCANLIWVSGSSRILASAS